MSTPADSATTDAEATPTPKTPRRWLRRMLWLVAALLLILVLSPLLIGISPVRKTVAEIVGEKLGRKVEIDGASAFWGSGLDIEGITVHSPEGFDGPLATIARVHVDLDLVAMIGGSISAKVRVVEPHITLRRDATGRGNQDGILEGLQKKEPAPEKKPAGPGPDLELVVIGGRFETPATQDSPANVVDELQLTLEMQPSGRKLMNMQASVLGAAQDGGDARIEARADLAADGTGPVSCSTPSLDLSRLARLVENATGLSGLRGSVDVKADLRLHADQTLDGKCQVNVENLGGTTSDAATFSIRRATLATDLRSVDKATEATWNMLVGDVRVSSSAGGARSEWREPEVSFDGQGRFSPADGLVRIAKARLNGGATATAQVQAPLRLETDPVLRAQGKASLRLDLRRLGDLRSLVPALESLAGGVLSATFDGRGGEGIDADVNINVDNLQLRPTEFAPDGYQDRSIVLAMNVKRSPQDGTRLTMHKLTSAVLQAAFGKERGLSIHVDPQGQMAMEGGFRMRVILPVLSTIVGGTLGLEPGERIAGTVMLTGNGVGEGERLRVDTTIEATQVVLPASWDEGRTRLDLRALVRTESSPTETTFTLSELHGMGLSGEGVASLVAAGDSMRLSQANARIGLDLGAARGWLAPVMALEPRARLSGRVNTSLQLIETDNGRELSATSQVNNLDWDRGPGTVPVREPRMSMQASIKLAPPGGRHRAEELRLETSGLRLDLSGSSYVAEPDTDLDLTLRLGGDAARLAPLMSALLGEGYEDLRGQGVLSGEVTLHGSPSENGRSMLVNGSLGFASWSTGGVVVENAKLALKRASIADPLATSLQAGVNKGTAQVDGKARLGGEMIPWNATVKVANVDTSTVLVSQGLGRYLAFVLPALLPAGKATPVLSGLLDADLQGSAPSISDPGLSNGLRGEGRVHMSGGEIKQSTLFGGNGGQLTKVISVLNVAVPEAGKVLQELSRAVTFSTLDSRFRVANRVLLLDEAKLIGQSAHIDMKGRVEFEQGVALETNVTLQGGGGRALAKVLPGGVIPLRVRGTLEKPQVSPNVDLTKLAASGLGGRIPSLLDDLKKKKLPGGIPNPFGR